MADDSPPPSSSISELLSRRVRVAAFRVRASVLLALFIAISGGAGYFIRGSLRTNIDPAHLPAPPSASSSLPSEASAPSNVSTAAPSSSTTVMKPEVDLFTRLRELESRNASDRSIDESLELARGHEELGEREVDSLTAKLSAKLDVALLHRLRDLSRDSALAPRVLGGLARHPSQASDDLIYEVSTDPHLPEALHYLADDLLAVPSVHAAASKSLTAILDLSRAHACDGVLVMVRRAKDVADDRALSGLRALDNEKGCGANRDQDCFPCLRDTSLLYEARAAVTARPFSPPWMRPSP